MTMPIDIKRATLTAEAILVIGHRNPDMDAIASAMGYAWVRGQAEKIPHIAGRPGECNTQTLFALQRFGVDAPPLVADVYTRVQDLTTGSEALHRGDNLLAAIQFIAKHRHPAPVVDDANRPVGLLTGETLFGTLAHPLSSTSVLELARALDQKVETANEGVGLVLKAGERIRDVLQPVLRAAQDEFMVVSESGEYVGLCSKSALLAPPRRKLVIVDHNEAGQAVPGLEETDLLEVLDHHRLGNPATAIPIRFRVEPVGSCSTLVAEEAFEHELTFPAPLAGLLLCGIISDTLVFRSPTTTPRDQRAAVALAEMAGLPTGPDGSRTAAIEALGTELLSAGAGLGARSGEEVISTDLKFYEANGHQAGIAQVEVTNFRELTPRLPELRRALEELAEKRGLALALLMVTDVVRSNSVLVTAGNPAISAALPYPRLDDGTLDAPGVVSRKKQLLPAVLAALSMVG